MAIPAMCSLSRGRNFRSGIGVFLGVPEHIDPVIALPVVSEDRDGLIARLHRNERSQFVGQSCTCASFPGPSENLTRRAYIKDLLCSIDGREFDLPTTPKRRLGQSPKAALEVADTGRVLITPQYIDGTERSRYMPSFIRADSPQRSPSQGRLADQAALAYWVLAIQPVQHCDTRSIKR